VIDKHTKEFEFEFESKSKIKNYKIREKKIGEK
jgi:hypothetical protein